MTLSRRSLIERLSDRYLGFKPVLVDGEEQSARFHHMKCVYFSSLFLLIPLFFAASGEAASARTCRFHKIELKRQVLPMSAQPRYKWTGSSGPYELSFAGDNSDKGMELRQAALTNTKTEKRCELEIDDSGITQFVFIAGNNQRLFIPKSYGSGDEYAVFDLESCKKIRADLNIYLTEIAGDALTSRSVCEHVRGQCSCSKATVYKLDGNCDLKFDSSASDALTKSKLGNSKPGELISCPRN